MSLLHRQEPQFVRRNTFIHACLGLLSASERYERFLTEASARRPSPPSEPSPAATVEGDELVLFALLGGLALSRRLREALAGAAPAQGAEVPRAAGGRSARPRDLAR